MEEWRPVYGYEGLYSVSNCGRVRSEKRTFVRKNGRPHTVPEKILACTHDSKGYRQALLYQGPGKKKVNTFVHKMVVEAFIKPLQGTEHVDHMNNVRDDNRLSNLQIMQDHKEHYGHTWGRIYEKKRQEGFDEGYKVGYSAGYEQAQLDFAQAEILED